MSFARAVFLFCDACPHGSVNDDVVASSRDYVDQLDAYLTVGSARAGMQLHGWHHVDGRDICPDCWREGRR